MERSSMPELRMHAERTPNPDSVKWVLGRDVVQGDDRADFAGSVDVDVSPLAAALLALDGVEAVLLGPDFVTVTKAADRAWSELAGPVPDAIRAWHASDAPALGPAWAPPEAVEDDAVTARIRRILDEEIGPYVAQDGGEILLRGFEDGVVRVHLRGACEGCPSSTITLKMGIEARLKQEIPEVRAVEAV
jgi:Fe-S cluster biogenesis protein NfuA